MYIDFEFSLKKSYHIQEFKPGFSVLNNLLIKFVRVVISQMLFQSQVLKGIFIMSALQNHFSFICFQILTSFIQLCKFMKHDR